MAAFALRRACLSSELLLSCRSTSIRQLSTAPQKISQPQSRTTSPVQPVQKSRTFAASFTPLQNGNNVVKPATPSSSTPAASSASSTSSTPAPTGPRIQNIAKTGLDDNPISDLDISSSDLSSLSPNNNNGEGYVDWTRSYHGLSAQPFSPEAAAILLQPLPEEDVEIKPDGIVYLPEIKYRRILNRAFGPGGWGLVPRSESIVTPKAVTREYALVAHGRLVSIARGEQDYFNPEGIPTATEGCKSNAMMRCCKDLGVASELWDPRWIRQFKAKNAQEVFVEHVVNKRKSKIWIRKGDPVSYPWKLTK